MKNGNLLPQEDDMRTFICFLRGDLEEGSFTNSSQCQGAVWLGDNVIAICDIDGKLNKGIIRIVRINSDDPYDVEIIDAIPVEGHSNDITYIPDKNVIIHPDTENKEINAIYLDNEKKAIYLDDKKEVLKKETIQESYANAISYDEENDKIVLAEDINGEVYSTDDFLNGKGPESKFVIPDRIKDKENGLYYNLRGGAAANDGKFYVSYTAYDEDKTSYNAHGDPPDIPKATVTVVYDYETGKCEKRIISYSNGEVESVTFDDDGNEIWIECCVEDHENNTYLYKSPK